MKKFLFIISFLMLHFVAFAQNLTIKGVVVDSGTGEGVEFATVMILNTGQWAVADAEGNFVLKNVPSGKNTVSASCLGYVTNEKEITVSKDIAKYKVTLRPDNLTLSTAVVTAKDNDNSAATSRTMDRTALDHIQMLNISDISSLLPGGATKNANLTTEQRFNIRAGNLSEDGNSSFGTAVEIDGVRLSGNASFSGTNGVTTNNIGSGNVESVEVISGVPSVEYGDIGSGIVKINTKKGKTPFVVSMMTNPNTKQLSLSKGFGIGRTKRGNSLGIVNVSAEYTRSVSDLRSPYTSYKRRDISVNYSNSFNKGIFADMPLRLTAGIAGNIGGMNSESDPDTFLDTYTKSRDNTIRGNLSLNWLLDKPFITSLEFSGSTVYSDKRLVENLDYSSASAVAALHGKEEGYFVAQDYSGDDNAPVVLIPKGYWYNAMYTDDRPLSYKLSLKANWARKFGDVNNKVKLGADWNADKNFGHGLGTYDYSTAPTFRNHDYSKDPFMNNLAVYLEDNVSIPIGKTRLNVIAGLRGEATVINGSQYGVTKSLSPRFNAKWQIITPQYRHREFLKELTFRGGWGVAVKQPSFAVLYPIESYQDIRVFNPTSYDGSAYYAYYVLPRNMLYNKELVWQRNKQSEIGMDLNLGGNKISVVAYYNRTLRSYDSRTSYETFRYNYTDQRDLASCTIPAADRVFDIDRNTGIVTVSDKTGILPSETISFTKKTSLTGSTYYANRNAPVNRYGLEWTIDFNRINPINTDIRVDGSFYGYRSVNTDLIDYSPNSTIGADGQPYKYVGVYYGGASVSNGREYKNVNMNVTFTTHIPKVRMIVSLKLESSLMRYSRLLSEGDGDMRTFAVDDNSSFVPSANPDFDGRRVYVATYPKTYYSADDPTPRDFLTDLLNAKENDPELYTDLSRLVQKTSLTYYFMKDYVSPYFSANVSVTKEIGDLASISFYANNFYRNLSELYSTRTRTYVSAAQYIPAFYYGLTLRLKF